MRVRVGINGMGRIGRAPPPDLQRLLHDELRRLIDAPQKGLRRARSAATNMFPTSTGAARAITKIIPELAGRLDGVAVRVPVADGALTLVSEDLVKVFGWYDNECGYAQRTIDLVEHVARTLPERCAAERIH